MSLLTRLFGGRAASRLSAPSDPKPGQWTSLLVPAVDQPFSERGLRTAFLLAQGTDATVYLAFLIEVPRALPLDAALPYAEEIAANALNIAERAALPYKVNVNSVIHRTRKAQERILSLISDERIDLLVLGARPDRLRGLPGDMARELFLAAPCEVIVDYIANEK